MQGLIRKVLLAARRTIAKDAKGVMKSDPRKAYKAVKSAVYRQILGGSVSILNKRGTKFDSYEPPRTLQPGQRVVLSPRVFSECRVMATELIPGLIAK